MHPHDRARGGFTLLELILSTSVLVVIMAILLQVVTAVQNTWRRGSNASDTALAAQHILALLADDLANVVATSPAESALSNATDTTPLVFALCPEDASEAEAVTPSGDSSASDPNPTGFSRLLFTRHVPRVVWDGGTAECTTLPRPARHPASDSTPRLRSLLGVLYSIEPIEPAENASSSSGDDSEATPPTPIRFALIRRTAGLAPDADHTWWEGFSDNAPGEILARNVVWFSATYPDFMASSTNRTDYAPIAAYATRSEPSLDLPPDTEIGPLPPLLDLSIALLPERDLQRIEALTDSTEQTRQIQALVRVYTQRIRLPQPRP